MKITIDNIVLNPDESEDTIIGKIKDKYHIDISDFSIQKKSLDARKKERIVYRYRITIEVLPDIAQILLKHPEVSEASELFDSNPNKISTAKPIIIVGSGPAGLFCALRLIEAGATVTIIERGKNVEQRDQDIRLLEEYGTLNINSNTVFGEGGAGTYSDGKLTTRTNRPEMQWFYKQLLKHGAPDSIEYSTRPHLGTDVLRTIIINIRNHILTSGSSIIFNESLSDITIQNNKVRSIITAGSQEYLSDTIVLATGHSARDIYRLMRQRQITLETKGFAVGFRIEHPRELIDDIQYGKSQYRSILPAAEYIHAFSDRLSKRGIYTFCMCPGGRIINSSSEPSRLCVNGMSYSSRNLPHSNAAFVISFNDSDFKHDPLSGINFQEQIEEKAYTIGGGNFIAPAQRITSFLTDRLDNDLPRSSYLPGICPAVLREIYPSWMIDLFKKGLHLLNNKMRGYITDMGIIVAAETRTSSPVRVCRDKSMQAIDVQGLYPIGEGAGYSGGIVSSAIDGIKAADAIISNVAI